MIAILIQTLLEAAPYIILGFLIAGIIRVYVPEGMLQKHLGTGGFLTLLKSVGIGCLLPLCSCGTIPLGIGLFRSGAALGNMLAFMTSAPVLSPVLIMLSLRLLGVKLTLMLLLTAAAGALIIGAAGNAMFRQKKTADSNENPKKEYTPNSVNPKASAGGKFLETLRWSFFELGAGVSVDILIGLGIASLLLAVLPLNWISAWLGQQDILTLIYVILLGLPVYACSIPSIAVVQGLLLLGVTPGAAVAYMMAGPATNLGELNAIRKAMGTKPALFYAAALLVIALIGGMITDQFIFPDYQYHAYRVQGELVVKQCCVPLIFGESFGAGFTQAQIPGWHWPFGVLLCVILLYGFGIKLKYFFINPCQTCAWKAYGKESSCGAQCHVRRKYEWVYKLRKRLKKK